MVCFAQNKEERAWGPRSSRLGPRVKATIWERCKSWSGWDKGLTFCRNPPGLVVLKVSTVQGELGSSMAVSQWRALALASTHFLGRIGAPSHLLSAGGQKFLWGKRTVENRSGTTSLQLILGLEHM